MGAVTDGQITDPFQYRLATLLRATGFPLEVGGRGTGNLLSTAARAVAGLTRPELVGKERKQVPIQLPDATSKDGEVPTLHSWGVRNVRSRLTQYLQGHDHLLTDLRTGGNLSQLVTAVYDTAALVSAWNKNHVWDTRLADRAEASLRSLSTSLGVTQPTAAPDPPGSSEATLA